MTSKKYWKKLSDDFLNNLKQLNKSDRIKLFGYSFKIYPGVFSPAISSDTHWFCEKILAHIKKKKFLEIGTGIGIIACLAAIFGAKKVVATDINKNAILNTKYNQKRLKLKFPVLLGNVFDPIPNSEKFDVIFWNHPFNYVENDKIESHSIESSIFDLKYKGLSNYLKNGKKYLKKNGKLLLGTSNIARINYIKKIARKEGYKMILLDKTCVPIYKNKTIQMNIRLYSFEIII